MRYSIALVAALCATAVACQKTEPPKAATGPGVVDNARIVNADQLKVQGVVIGVLRSYN